VLSSFPESQPGIVRRHSPACPSLRDGRCNCGAGYEAWVYLPREKRKVRKTLRRKSEAKAWRADALSAAARGGLRGTTRDARTMTEVLAEFVEGMRAGTIRPKGRERYKPNTIRSYDRALRVHIALSKVGNLKVCDMQRSDLQGFADELLPLGLSVGTVSNILNPIQAFCRRAVDRGELAVNPAEKIDLPNGTSQRPTRIASAAEATALLAALRPEDRPVWATAFYAGLRRGELQPLRCRDLDFKANLIHIERGWDQEEGAIEPKSRSGRRGVPMMALLRQHLEMSLQWTGGGGDDLVFGRRSRDAFVASTVDNRAKRAWASFNAREREDAEAAGRDPALLVQITLHECRHTFASLLIDAGANPKAVQTFMGHSKIQTTFDIYGHLLPGSYDDVRAQMDAYLAGRSTPHGTL
jgi:integrase